MDTRAPRTGSEWEPERVVDTASARELISAEFGGWRPGLRAAVVEPLATGWDNTVFRVTERGGDHDAAWVFRFPRREIAVPGVRQEIAVLPRLAGLLPLPIPNPTLLARPSERFPWPFWGARLISGTELAEADLSDDARIASAADVGAFLAALHDAPTVAEVGAGLPLDPLSRGDPGVRAPKARRLIGDLTRRGVLPPDPDLDGFLVAAAQVEPPAGTPVLSHGDLHIRHVLVGTDARASGVIDWGDLCLADPAVDLSLAYTGYAGRARAALLAAYGATPDPTRETTARVLGVFLCAALAGYAAATGRPRLLAASLAGIARAVPR